MSRLTGCAISALGALQCANAWGMDGHSIVAAIAQRIVSDKVVSAVNNTLGHDQDMIGVSSWADAAAHSKEYHWTEPLHYINTPTRGCDFDYERDCPKDWCVIGGIQNYSARAVDDKLPSSEREFAMKLLIHFLGDIHQPLHVGFGKDRGGNSIHVTTDFGSAGHHHEVHTELHRVWDSGIIDQAEHDLRPGSDRRRLGGFEMADQKDEPHESRWHDLLEQVWSKISEGGEFAPHRQEWVSTCRAKGLFECSKEMAEQSLAVACQAAYHDEYSRWIANNDHLDRKYYETREPQVLEQLAKGGVRLAWVLKEMYYPDREVVEFYI